MMRGLAVITVLLGMAACATEAGLQSKTWTWERTIYNNDTEQMPNEAGAFTLTFTDEGQVQVTTDCNNMRGSYTVEEHRLKFGMLASTRMYCQDSQEELFAYTLGHVTSHFINDEGQLILELKYDTGSMIFN
jgi:heat shock protein HslJ